MVLLPVTFPTFLTAPSLSETTMATLPGSGHPMSTNAEGSPRASCNPFAASCTHQHNIHCNCRQRVLAPSTTCSSSLAERFFYCGSLADVALRPKELQHGCHLFPEGVPELHATVRPVSHWGTTVCTCRDLLSAPSRRATSIRAPLSRRTASLARPADLASASSARSLASSFSAPRASSCRAAQPHAMRDSVRHCDPQQVPVHAWTKSLLSPHRACAV